MMVLKKEDIKEGKTFLILHRKSHYQDFGGDSTGGGGMTIYRWEIQKFNTSQEWEEAIKEHNNPDDIIAIQGDVY